MKMFLVEALTRTQTVEDLGITVSPNLSQVITPEQFSSSLCLQELIRKGHLRASRVSLCREEKPAKPGKKKPPLQKGPQAPPQETQLISKPQKDISSTPVANTHRRIQSSEEALTAAVEKAIKAVVEETVATTVATVVKTELNKIVVVSPGSQANLQAPVKSLAPEISSVSSDEPLFIPSGLVPKGSSGEISISSETQEADSLGDSASALKKLRKGKGESK
jgi:hypothetical protein